jgi:hypothetical protein
LRLRLEEEIRHASRDFGVLVAGVAAILGERALMQNDQALLMARKGRIQELAREKPARVGQHDDGHAELAPLRLVDREAVGELKRVLAFIPELAGVEAVLVAKLAGELDLELPGKPLELLRLVLAHNDADVAIGEVGLPVGLWPDVTAALVQNVDHLVTVEDRLGAYWPGHFAPPTFRPGEISHLMAEAFLDHPIQGVDADEAGPDR